MNSFRWLHLTDLHWGSEDHKNYWGQIEPELFKDIRKLHKKCGEKWDAVFFTGDLVNRGSEEEYIELDGRLKRLKEHLNELGSDPVFLAVPGNHDLVRPDENDPVCMGLTELWEKKEPIRNAIWKEDKESPYFKMIEESFNNFEKWCGNPGHRFLSPENITPGLLPGDFAATLKKGKYKIGVIGLNTAFLQLKNGDFKGKLDVHASQMVKVCEMDYQDWIDRHDVCFLMTHHPEEWLSEAGKKEMSVIAPPDRFALHLCGHQHKTFIYESAFGGAKETKRVMQACSVFGSEKYFEWNEEGKEIKIDRRHGYCAGRIDFSESEAEANIRLWPRSGIKKAGGIFRFDKDIEQHFDDDEDDDGTIPVKVNLKRKLKKNQSRNEAKQEIKDLVSSKIEELLSKKRLLDFRDILIEKIKIRNPGILSNGETNCSKVLVDNLKKSMLILQDSVKVCLEKFSDEDKAAKQIEQLWEDSVSIIGWLVLLSVKDSWIKKNEKMLANGSKAIHMAFPVRTETSVEIVYSRINESGAEFSNENNCWEISGRKNIDCGDLEIETGWKDSDKLNEILRIIWTSLFKGRGEAPQKMESKYIDEVKSTLEYRADSGETYYLAIDINKGDLLTNESIRQELFKTLGCLSIILIDVENHGEVFIVPETDLLVWLQEFFRNKPDLGNN